MLRALDGPLAGATHREIVGALIGPGRVQPTGAILTITCAIPSAAPSLVAVRS
ncbi:DUF2285 domain-containing protein [Mesorhizobium australicum]